MLQVAGDTLSIYHATELTVGRWEEEETEQFNIIGLQALRAVAGRGYGLSRGI